MKKQNFLNYEKHYPWVWNKIIVLPYKEANPFNKNVIKFISQNFKIKVSFHICFIYIPSLLKHKLKKLRSYLEHLQKCIKSLITYSTLCSLEENNAIYPLLWRTGVRFQGPTCPTDAQRVCLLSKAFRAQLSRLQCETCAHRWASPLSTFWNVICL